MLLILVRYVVLKGGRYCPKNYFVCSVIDIVVDISKAMTVIVCIDI